MAIKPDMSAVDAPAAYYANTGDKDFDYALNNLNNLARADLDDFMNKGLLSKGKSQGQKKKDKDKS